MIDYLTLDRLQQEHEARLHLFPELQGGRYVAGEGDSPEAFIVGEAPGAAEALAGRPFIGPAGQVLRELMGIAGLSAGAADRSYAVLRVNAWVTNVVKFRPPKNRNPTELEIKAFRGLLHDEWKAVGAPNLIIPVGGTALKAVTGKPLSILRAAGKCHGYTSKNGNPLYIWPMVHPAFGLRQSAQIQELLEDDWERLGRWRATDS